MALHLESHNINPRTLFKALLFLGLSFFFLSLLIVWLSFENQTKLSTNHHRF